MDLVHVSEDRWTVVSTFKENDKEVNVAGMEWKEI